MSSEETSSEIKKLREDLNKYSIELRDFTRKFEMDIKAIKQKLAGKGHNQLPLDVVTKEIDLFIQQAHFHTHKPVRFSDLSRRFAKTCNRFGGILEVLRQMEQERYLKIIHQADNTRMIYNYAAFEQIPDEEKQFIQIPPESRADYLNMHKENSTQAKGQKLTGHRYVSARQAELIAQGMDEMSAMDKAVSEAQELG